MSSLYNAVSGIERLEQLAVCDSPVHRLHPFSKLFITVVFIFTVISFPSQNISGLIPFIFYPVIMMAVSGTPYRPLLSRLAFALPFSLMAGLSNLIMVQGTAFYIGGLAVSYGLISFLSIMVKTLLTVLSVLMLIATTSFIEVSYQLVYLRVPKPLCLQLVMTYRYLTVLISEAVSMYTAYSLRSPMRKGIEINDIGSFLGQLILRSFDRAERVYQAMKCRGFQGVYHGRKRERLRMYDWLFISLLTFVMLVMRYINISVLVGGLARILA